MGGSRKWMVYTSDVVLAENTPLKYAVQIDESNGELLGFDDIAAGDAIPQQLPKGFQMRCINVVEPVTGTRRTLPVGKPGLSIYEDGGSILLRLDLGAVTAGLVSFLVQSATGEILKKAFGADTGLLDGDAE